MIHLISSLLMDTWLVIKMCIYARNENALEIILYFPTIRK